MRVAVAVILSGLLAGSAGAQAPSRTILAADSAFAAGNVPLADSLYYVAVRQRPRDPIAREALGRYLAAQGRAKVAVVLLEEARMFGGEPSAIARQLAPLYEYLGEWRALLTLSGLPMTTAERRRVAWLSDHPFGAVTDGGAASIIGVPKGDTIARIAVRLNGRAAVAAIVSSDVGFLVGARIGGGDARRFDGDSTTVVFDSLIVGQVKFVNVPARVGAMASTMTVGVAALGRMVVTIDYGRSRLALTRNTDGQSQARYLLVRDSGQLKVLQKDRWVPLGDFAASIAKASKTIVVDVAAGEVRIR